ncbi:MAG TPA: ligase-associated DNA damage response exonuclease [Vicinamibacteria bacterium]|nr:ligase-associated DNA damage response exonuclease [Vicinamibacteria bacterium]
MRPDDLVAITPAGLHCAAGGFHVDPWGSADLAIITHAHADHARPVARSYLCAEACVPLLRRRLGPEASIRGVPYGERLRIGSATVSLHPAGHVLGSAQVRIEESGRVFVVSGDYKRAPDPTCAPFEVVRCDVFVTEATFGLPIYRWEEPSVVAAEIHDWWRANPGRPSVLFAYALGKAQRILAELAPLTDRPVLTHGAVESLVRLYREAGIPMLRTEPLAEAPRKRDLAGALILAPPSARATPWMRRLASAETAMASGWMRVRGPRRRQGYDRGFALSDHADWPALLRTIEETGARRVLATHGYAEELARFLGERGFEAEALATSFEGEADA